LGDWANVAPWLAFFAGLAWLPDLALAGATWALVCRERRLLGGLWLLGRGSGFGVGGFGWNAARWGQRWWQM
jgi:hypothetical protein